MSQETFRPDINQPTSQLKKDYPQARLVDSEEEEFDPNELKLLPVLATERNANK